MALVTSQTSGDFTVHAAGLAEPTIVVSFDGHWTTAHFTPDEARKLAADLIAAADTFAPQAVSA